MAQPSPLCCVLQALFFSGLHTSLCLHRPSCSLMEGQTLRAVSPQGPLGSFTCSFTLHPSSHCCVSRCSLSLCVGILSRAHQHSHCLLPCQLSLLPPGRRTMENWAFVSIISLPLGVMESLGRWSCMKSRLAAFARMPMPVGLPCHRSLGQWQWEDAWV